MKVATSLLMVLFQAGPAAPHDPLRLPPSAVAPATHQQLRAIIGSESEARPLVRGLIEQYIQGRRREHPESHRGTINVVAEQLPHSWLPRIGDVQFQRIPVAKAKDRCVRRMWVTAEMKEQILMLAVREGNDCGHTASLRELERTSGRWLLHGGIDVGLPASVGGAVRQCSCITK